MKIEKVKVYRKAVLYLQERKGSNLCPRCGSLMKKNMKDNAISVLAGVYICQSCGWDELSNIILGNSCSLENWKVCIYDVE